MARACTPASWARTGHHSHIAQYRADEPPWYPATYRKSSPQCKGGRRSMERSDCMSTCTRSRRDMACPSSARLAGWFLSAVPRGAASLVAEVGRRRCPAPAPARLTPGGARWGGGEPNAVPAAPGGDRIPCTGLICQLPSAHPSALSAARSAPSAIACQAASLLRSAGRHHLSPPSRAALCPACHTRKILAARHSSEGEGVG